MNEASQRDQGRISDFTLDLGRNYDFITSNVTPLSRFQDDKETYRREIKKIAAKNFEKHFPVNEFFERRNFEQK